MSKKHTTKKKETIKKAASDIARAEIFLQKLQQNPRNLFDILLNAILLKDTDHSPELEHFKDHFTQEHKLIADAKYDGDLLIAEQKRYMCLCGFLWAEYDIAISYNRIAVISYLNVLFEEYMHIEGDGNLPDEMALEPPTSPKEQYQIFLAQYKSDLTGIRQSQDSKRNQKHHELCGEYKQAWHDLTEFNKILFPELADFSTKELNKVQPVVQEGGNQNLDLSYQKICSIKNIHQVVSYYFEQYKNFNTKIKSIKAEFPELHRIISSYSQGGELQKISKDETRKSLQEKADELKTLQALIDQYIAARRELKETIDACPGELKCLGDKNLSFADLTSSDDIKDIQQKTTILIAANKGLNYAAKGQGDGKAIANELMDLANKSDGHPTDLSWEHHPLMALACIIAGIVLIAIGIFVLIKYTPALISSVNSMGNGDDYYDSDPSNNMGGAVLFGFIGFAVLAIPFIAGCCLFKYGATGLYNGWRNNVSQNLMDIKMQVDDTYQYGVHRFFSSNGKRADIAGPAPSAAPEASSEGSSALPCDPSLQPW